ncbi:hypothetical protein DSECCO2_524580 [anaerobic digester metagenome]
MKKHVVKLFFILLSIGLLTSCQMEKRQYMRGFFINKTACRPDSGKTESSCHGDTNAEIKLADAISQNEYPVTLQQNAENTIASNNDFSLNDLLLPKKTTHSDQFVLLRKDTISGNLKKRIQSDIQRIISENDDPPKVHPLAKVAAAVVLFAILSIFTLAKLKIPGVGYFLFLLLFLILPIAALVMLFIASRKTKRNPDKWKGPIWVTLLTIALAI